ncbi:putative clathrin assembly protein At1g03050 [Neltuma alba]|uniref:putative clathrin assembly protein At1g03050 n=1 Tax=Neltuma alba TaxID=207710 RepID=UPI0010A35282|nr:putative clathrin assembly protein At1g03050 [Prosopis alba]XP_028787109.1 putative clathrin assembly protein At1g03050 [Prosopis alba]
MAPSKIKKALGAVKDQTTISLAKVGSSTSLADLEVAIVKATKHNEHPAEEKYIREILSLTCYSRTYISACVTTLSKRLNKTRSWTVAMKTLILIQRLLYEGDPAYEQEIFFSTRRGTRILNLSDFRDNGKSLNSWDFSAFVRTYALYLDERLEYKMQNRRGKKSTFGCDEEEEENKDKDKDKEKEKESFTRSTPIRDMKTEQIFSKMQHLQLLLERFLACRPTGAAKTHRIVIVSLYPIVKDSFQIYSEVTEILSTLLDRFEDLQMQDCIKVYDIFCRVGKQFDELDLFYCWCKSIGIARSSEYPQIEKINSKQLEVMEEYIKEKSAAAQGKASNAEEKNEEEEAKVEELEEDVNTTKALPPPVEEPKVEEVIEEPIKEKPKEEEQKEADLLHLGDDVPTTEEQGDKLALALFDGAAPGTASATQALPWHAFDEEADWETALVQSTSNLPNQKPELGGGFDTLLLDGMYKQAEVNAAMQGPGFIVSGSSSSMALGSAGRPALLALPAPPTSGGSTDFGPASTDPFAASLGVAPPSYVQMSEMEKKQGLLVEEQVLWQQYTREGMQGEATLSRLERNAYMGAYAQPNPGSNYR